MKVKMSKTLTTILEEGKGGALVQLLLNETIEEQYFKTNVSNLHVKVFLKGCIAVGDNVYKVGIADT